MAGVAIATGLTLAAQLFPSIANLILAIRHPDGSVTLVTMLDQNDAGFEATIKSASDWIAAHPASAPVAPATSAAPPPIPGAPAAGHS